MIGERLTPTGVVIYDGEPNTDEWLAARQVGIGGSDIPAIMGMSNYNSPTQIYRQKRGEEIPSLPEDVLEAAQWGHDMEDVLARRFNRDTGFIVERFPYTIAHVERPWQICNLDGRVKDSEWSPLSAIAEIKTRSAYQMVYWPADGNPPDDVMVQTQWNIDTSGYDSGFVIALIGGNRFRWYQVYRDDAAIALMREMAEEFWENTQAGIAPPADGSKATEEIYNWLWDVEPGKVEEISDQQIKLLTARQSHEREIDKQQRAIDLIDNQLRLAIQDGEALIYDRKPVVTWKRNGNFASKRFAEAHPEVAEQCMTEKLDSKLVKEKFPELYAKFQARAFRVNYRRLPRDWQRDTPVDDLGWDDEF